MDLYLYSFNKKHRSTKRPSGGQLWQGNLREPSGILSPTFAIQFNTDYNPHVWNYLYVPEFERYYWIDEWVFLPGSIWQARTHVDVLASWKDQIGATPMYVLRSSATYNGRITDTKYPTIARANSYIDDSGYVSEVYNGQDILRSNYWNKPLSGGYYYLGVVGDNATGVTWYLMTPSTFNTLTQELFNFNPTDITDVSTGLAKELANPMQYIVSCYWLPTDIYGVTYGSGTVNFGRFSISMTGGLATFDPVSDMHKYWMTFPIRKHPQASDRGIFMNQAPYTNYRIVMQPFGTFDLDGTLMIDDTEATAEWYIDYTTGIADLTIKVTNSFMVHTSAMMGVPIRLTQATVDTVGFAGGLLDIGKGLITGALGGGLIGGAAGVVGGFLNCTAAKQPTVSSVGGGGNFVPFHSYGPKIYSDFYWVADDFNEEIGRPLCQVRTPASLGGFIQALEGDMDIKATAAELEEINGFITGGFFYE